jgi:hypothetical protein
VIRTQVLGLLEKRGSPVKLWEPESAGLGKIWAAQGWVLWRWFLPSDATPAADLDIKWLDVPIEGQEGFFSLAAAIAKAAATAAREIK